MARSLVRCPSCGVHVYEGESRCPFCSARASTRRKAAMGALAGAAGAIAFVSGIGCAYGCPDPGCVDRSDGGADASGDVHVGAEASVGDARTDGPLEASTDAGLDGPAGDGDAGEIADAAGD